MPLRCAWCRLGPPPWSSECGSGLGQPGVDTTHFLGSGCDAAVSTETLGLKKWKPVHFYS